MRYVLILALVLSSCKLHTTETTVAQTKNTDTATPAQDLCAAVTKISGEYCLPQKFDTQSLAISFLGAGVQTIKRLPDDENDDTFFYRFVRLFFHASLERDYLEIMRCNGVKRNELECRDGRELDARESTPELQQELNNPFGTTVNRAGLRDCWASIAGSQDYGCVLLGGAEDGGDRTGRIYADEHFVDVSAPAGQTFFYVARPCLHEDRANELTSGNKNCSQNLYVSNIVTDFESDTIDTELLDARKKVAALAARLNYMTDQAYKITLDFSRAMQLSEEDDIKRERSKRLRQGVAMIAGMTVGAAGAVYTVGVDSIGSGLDAGQALGAAFADIIASKDDYPQSCYECIKLRAKLVEVVGDVDGNDFNADGTDFIPSKDKGIFGDISLTKNSGYLYQQVLDKYAEALQALDKLQMERGRHQSEASLLDKVGQGGPL